MGHRPVPTSPLYSGKNVETWDELDRADIETMTLQKFMEKMAAQYEDWEEFMQHIEDKEYPPLKQLDSRTEVTL